MKVGTFVQFLQKFWWHFSACEYRKVVEVLNANPLWVGWARYYSANYVNWGERPEAPFKGSYDIKTIKEAWNLMELMLESYEVGYNDGYDYCDKNRPSC